MPLFWQYCLTRYLKILFLGVGAIIAILLLSRLQEIAQFATLGASVKVILLFTLAQIPYILPIAIPLASLVAALVLTSHLSDSQELTSLRASGLSVWQILTPLFLVSIIFSGINFYLTSEVATRSHLAARKMLFEITSINPLVLLQKAKIAPLEEAVVVMDPIKSGEKAQNVIVALNHRANKRLNLFISKKIALKERSLMANNTTLVASAKAPLADHLLIENQQTSTTAAPKFAYLLRKKGWKIANDHLSLPLLRARSKLLKEKMTTVPSHQAPPLRKRIKKCQTEIARRLCLALAAFTFPLLGLAFGLNIGRNRSKFKVVVVALLAALALTCFFVAKEFDHLVFLASSLFLLPHLLIASIALTRMFCLQRGRE